MELPSKRHNDPHLVENKAKEASVYTTIFGEEKRV